MAKIFFNVLAGKTHKGPTFRPAASVWPNILAAAVEQSMEILKHLQ